MTTKEEWEKRADELRTGGLLEVNGFVLCDYGELNYAGIDALSRKIFKVLDLTNHSISAPEWGGMWKCNKDEKIVWRNWSLGTYDVCVSPEKIDENLGYRKYIVVPGIPELSYVSFPDDCKTRKERQAWKDLPEQVEGRERAKFIDVLALHHFAVYLLKNRARGEREEEGP
jgi:hypothetical protein